MLFLLIFWGHKQIVRSCPASDAFLVPQEWFQPGDIIIGGMMSQFFYHLYEIEFKEHPSLIQYDLPIFCLFLSVITLVPQVIGRKGLKGEHSAVMIVFHAQKQRFQIKL
ncbi:hypothetical protein E2320_003565, partial [Naja naja]